MIELKFLQEIIQSLSSEHDTLYDEHLYNCSKICFSFLSFSVEEVYGYYIDY